MTHISGNLVSKEGQSRIEHLLEALLSYGQNERWFAKEDRVYFRNRLVDFLSIAPYTPDDSLVAEAYKGDFASTEGFVTLLNHIVTWAAAYGRISSAHPDTADYFDTALVDVLLPRPSQVIETFNLKYGKSVKEASQWYYHFSQATQYIRTARVAQNVIWTQPTPYGEMVFTINLSKPEKDPKSIAAQGSAVSENYPKCLLCYENVGYGGHSGHPARHNHRVIPLRLSGEEWFLQYSPYVYYNEHAIVINQAHVPMAITERTFIRLLDFVDFLPHYFVGSNADLPIVGGSMLSHDHYQAGNYQMPMAKSAVRSGFVVPSEPSVSFEWLQWPLTTLRLKSSKRESISAMAAAVLKVWRHYDDSILGLKSAEHTITPIARKSGDVYELDLVLRSCQVSAEHPDGVYHPHREIHHVKKENIGLIEVMGLAVLPPRLATLTKVLSNSLFHQLPEVFSEDISDAFQALYKDVFSKNPQVADLETAQTLIYTAIGEVFVRGLEHCGVMPLNAVGDAARVRFQETLIKEVAAICS